MIGLIQGPMLNLGLMAQSRTVPPPTEVILEDGLSLKVFVEVVRARSLSIASTAEPGVGS